MNSPVERFERQYRAAAAEGAIVELRLRLLADKIPELQKFAHAQNLESVETLIVQHFSSTLTEEEAKTFELCRQLRNKLLHCDFRAARKKLEQLGVKTSRGGVKKIDVRGLSFPAQLIEKITSVKANVVGTFETVADSAFEAGSVFAWLIEVGQAGDFIQAVDAFARASVIIERLAWQ